MTEYIYCWSDSLLTDLHTCTYKYTNVIRRLLRVPTLYLTTLKTLELLSEAMKVMRAMKRCSREAAISCLDGERSADTVQHPAALAGVALRAKFEQNKLNPVK